MEKRAFVIYLLIILIILGIYQINFERDEEIVSLQPTNVVNLFEEVLNQNEPYYSNFKWNHPRLPGPHDGNYLQRIQNDPNYYNLIFSRADNFDPTSPFYEVMLDTWIAYSLTKLEGSPNQQYLDKIFTAVSGPLSGYGRKMELYARAYIYDWAYNDLSQTQRDQLEILIKQNMIDWKNDYENVLQVSVYNSIFYNRLGVSYVPAAIVLYDGTSVTSQEFQQAGFWFFDDWLKTWKDEKGWWQEGADYRDRQAAMVYVTLDAVSSAFNVDLFEQEDWVNEGLYSPIYDVRPDVRMLNRGDTTHHTLYQWNLFPSYLGLATKYMDEPVGQFALGLYSGIAPWGTGGSYNNLKPSIEGVTPSIPWSPSWPENPNLLNPYDPDNGAPLAYYAEGIGQVFIRSDWTENARHIRFGVDPGYWSHSGIDSGTFEIYDNGALAVIGGNYGFEPKSGHDRNYKFTTLAQNAMLFYDVDDYSENYYICAIKEPSSLSCSNPNNWNQVPNDGGQRKVRSGFQVPTIYDIDAKEQRSEEFNLGSIERINLNDEYVYILADLKPAYNPVFDSFSYYSPNSIGIEFLYPNVAIDRTKRIEDYYDRIGLSIDDVFIVFDRFELTKPDIKPIWLLHMINEPQTSQNNAFLQDNVVEILRTENVFCKGLEYTCNWPSSLNNANGQYYQYEARMRLTNVYPGQGNVQIDSVGGQGQEWADISGPNNLGGVNHDGCSAVSSNPTVTCAELRNPDPSVGFLEQGSWRVQLTNPGTQGNSDYFLNVMQTVDSSSFFAPVQELQIVSGDVVGTLIETENSEIWSVTFGKNNFVLSDIIYNLNMVGNVKNLITDLFPGLDYEVTVRDDTGNLISQQVITSSSEGLLRFDSSIAGDSEVTIRLLGQSPCLQSEMICNDGIDNDCDGEVDCNDSDCSGVLGICLVNPWVYVGNPNVVSGDPMISINPDDDIPVVVTKDISMNRARGLKWDGMSWNFFGGAASHGESFYHPVAWGILLGQTTHDVFTFVRAYSNAVWGNSDGETSYYDPSVGDWILPTVPASPAIPGGTAGAAHNTWIDINTNNVNSPFYNTPVVAHRDQIFGDYLTVQTFDVVTGSYNYLTSGVYGVLGSSSIGLQVADNGDIYVAFTSGGLISVIKRDVLSGNWDYVGFPGFTNGIGVNLELDNNEVPCISYLVGNGYVFVDCFNPNSGGWEHLGDSFAGDKASTGNLGWRAIIDLEFDTQNKVYVSYVSDSTGANPEYANVRKFEDGMWRNLGVVEFSNARAQYLTIAIDSLDRVYASFTNRDDGNRLKVMRNDNIVGSACTGPNCPPTAPSGLSAGFS